MDARGDGMVETVGDAVVSWSRSDTLRSGRTATRSPTVWAVIV